MGGAFGYYGKIPAQGDFLRKGLSPDFVSRWDQWLQGALLAAKEVLGSRWQDAYFSAPIWRFALGPGTSGPKAAVGVLMPSVDRVGRQFPLTLVAECEAESGWAAYQSAAPVFDGLENVALGMLEDTATTTELDEKLKNLAPMSTYPPRPTTASTGTALTVCGAGLTDSALIVAGMLSSYGHSPSIWVASLEGVIRAMVTPGLPAGAEEACALMDSSHLSWAAHPDPASTEALI